MQFEELRNSCILCDTHEQQLALMDFLHANGVRGDSVLERDITIPDNGWRLIGRYDGEVHGYGISWRDQVSWIRFDEFAPLAGCGSGGDLFSIGCLDELLA